MLKRVFVREIIAGTCIVHRMPIAAQLSLRARHHAKEMTFGRCLRRIRALTREHQVRTALLLQYHGMKLRAQADKCVSRASAYHPITQVMAGARVLITRLSAVSEISYIGIIHVVLIKMLPRIVLPAALYAAREPV